MNWYTDSVCACYPLTQTAVSYRFCGAIHCNKSIHIQGAESCYPEVSQRQEAGRRGLWRSLPGTKKLHGLMFDIVLVGYYDMSHPAESQMGGFELQNIKVYLEVILCASLHKLFFYTLISHKLSFPGLIL